MNMNLKLGVLGVVVTLLVCVSAFGREDLVEKGKSYYYSGKFELAKLSFEKALRSVTNEEILLMLGNSYLATGDYKKAIEAFRHGKTISQREWVFEFNLGYTYYVLRDYTNSLRSFLAVREKVPMFGKTYWFGGMSALRVVDISTTVELWEKYLEIEPRGEESENIRKALALLKEFGTNAIPEILASSGGEFMDIDLLIRGVENGFEIKGEQKTLEDVSLEDIEK